MPQVAKITKFTKQSEKLTSKEHGTSYAKVPKCTVACVYIYIYMYLFIFIYIYIFIYREREREGCVDVKSCQS